jgi:hypothetical protein
MLQECYGFAARAYHGGVAAQSISTWHPDKYEAGGAAAVAATVA